jgi:hypothetical protein
VAIVGEVVPAIPHDLLLAFLWPAYLVVTVITGLCILFTGRYPRPLFDFTSGVLRWSWPVSYCAAHGGPGTGQYPPFRLHQGESEPTLPPQPPMVDPAIPLGPGPGGHPERCCDPRTRLMSGKTVSGHRWYRRHR